jgi:hypothetical protein
MKVTLRKKNEKISQSIGLNELSHIVCEIFSVKLSIKVMELMLIRICNDC